MERALRENGINVLKDYSDSRNQKFIGDMRNSIREQLCVAHEANSLCYGQKESGKKVNITALSDTFGDKIVIENFADSETEPQICFFICSKFDDCGNEVDTLTSDKF